MIRFTPSRRIVDRRQTYVPHDGEVSQRRGKVKKNEASPLIITEYGILPPPTPIEKKRILDTEKFLEKYFHRERE